MVNYYGNSAAGGYSYPRATVEEARRVLRFHCADADGMCAACRFGRVWVRAGECDAAIWASKVIRRSEPD